MELYLRFYVKETMGGENMSFGICVEELLQAKCLRRSARIIAGEKGLSNLVNWVHVLEIRDIVKECVNGHELILTSGISFTNKEVAVKYLTELIEQEVSGLCIDTTLYYRKVDQEVIDLANQSNFPLIVITEFTRFIDICRDLNTMILNNDAKLIQGVDYYDNQLKVEKQGSIEDSIKYTAEYLNLHVAYLSQSGKSYISSSSVKKLIDPKLLELSNLLEGDEMYCRGNVAIKSLKILGKNWGHLFICSSRKDISEFETMIMQRLASKLQNDIFTELVIKEKKLYKNNEWLKFWLQGNLSEIAMRERMKELSIFQKFGSYVVCVAKLPLDESSLISGGEVQIGGKLRLFDDFLLHITIIVRRIFEDQGFSVLGYMEDNIISYIVMIPNETQDILAGLDRAIEQLRDYQNQFINYKSTAFSIGKKVNTSQELDKSYKTALFGLNMIDQMPNRIIIYDKLYIIRIMEQLKTQGVLEEFITDHLGALLDPANEELINTLRIYYECHCSKQKTAERLFIVRQTLYFRLQKIEDILGKDFDEGEKRFAVEFAMNALRFLESKISETPKTSLLNQ